MVISASEEIEQVYLILSKTGVAMAGMGIVAVTALERMVWEG